MANDQSKLILTAGVSFQLWKSILQAKLARRNVLGHVFHEIPGIRPLLSPILSNLSNDETSEQDKSSDEKLTLLE